MLFFVEFSKISLKNSVGWSGRREKQDEKRVKSSSVVCSSNEESRYNIDSFNRFCVSFSVGLFPNSIIDERILSIKLEFTLVIDDRANKTIKLENKKKDRNGQFLTLPFLSQKK